MAEEIFAAGTVCWRREVADDGRERTLVLLIHRPKRRDYSFPKGKLDAGESLPQAAVRETREETGLKVRLGVHLGTIHYEVSKSRRKTVQYWAAEVSEKAAHAMKFRANSEVDAIEWVPASEARERLTYPADQELFDVFLDLEARDLLETFSMTVLRHAKALPRRESSMADHLRPLTSFGEEQAETLVPTLDAFGPRKIYSSTAVRCRSTVAPLAHYRDKRVRETDAISQDAWDAGELDRMRRLVEKVVNRRKNAVICSHRPVIPDIARALADATESPRGEYLSEATSLPPGGFSVFHISKRHPERGIIVVETYPLKH
ncbi:NUDIX hydrolase [Leucobacter sp. USHLN153]|uniref:NUDIX hydrolase n=1 Tax=Leucobacter sp. USHLN153 TaxID=3081268 RepID=UPI00301B37F9